MPRRNSSLLFLCAIAAVFTATEGFAHHEAIFGPQSASMIARQRFASAQYYVSNAGTGAERSRSQIGVLTVGVPIAESWSVSASLPIESIDAEGQQRRTGTQDVVFAVRRKFMTPNGDSVMGVLTAEPPTTGNLEHRAVGIGGGALYAAEWNRWEAVGYVLGRTENSLERGERRGNRLFVGSGVAYETEELPFAPQLGVSWELTGRREEGGTTVAGSNSSVIFVHPTVVFDLVPSAQMFAAVSLPVAQWSGDQSRQGTRFATGIIWSF